MTHSQYTLVKIIIWRILDTVITAATGLLDGIRSKTTGSICVPILQVHTTA